MSTCHLYSNSYAKLIIFFAKATGYSVLCAQSKSRKCGKALRKEAVGATIGLKRKNLRVRLAEWQEITRAENSILDSPSYKSAMRDVDQGHITTYKNADDMFNDLMKEE